MRESPGQILIRKKMTLKTLVVIAGPTAVGKTNVSADIARLLGTEIISADARQFYRELKVGTAFPSPEVLDMVPHHLVGHLSVFDQYNVVRFEQDALFIAEKLFKQHNYVVVTGGSGLYLDTFCEGMDDLPGVDEFVRDKVQAIHQKEGLTGLRTWLQKLDPDYYGQVDPANPSRIKRALEVCLVTGKPYSSFRTRQPKARPFNVVKIILDRPRDELFARINERVDQMVACGLIEEALEWFPHRHLNALNTVGYKELFQWLSNHWALSTALEKIKTNTRRYAKRQLTWFRRDQKAHWFHPDQMDEMLECIQAASRVNHH